MPISSTKKFQKIRNRVRDMQQCHGQGIKEGKFVHMNLIVVAEMAWMVQEIERLAAIEALPPLPALEEVERVEDEEIEPVGA